MNIKDVIIPIAKDLKIEPATIYAIIMTESKGNFTLKGGKIPILLERHWIYKFLKKEYKKEYADKMKQKYPNLCNNIPGDYGKYSKQYKRLAMASKLFGTEISHLSTSFGAFQIMGFNHDFCGFDTAKEMSDAYHDNPVEEQIKGFMSFVKHYHNGKLLNALRDKRWREVARIYNGSGYKKNNYHNKLAYHYNDYNKR